MLAGRLWVCRLAVSGGGMGLVSASLALTVNDWLLLLLLVRRTMVVMVVVMTMCWQTPHLAEAGHWAGTQILASCRAPAPAAARIRGPCAAPGKPYTKTYPAPAYSRDHDGCCLVAKPLQPICSLARHWPPPPLPG